MLLSATEASSGGGGLGGHRSSSAPSLAAAAAASSAAGGDTRQARLGTRHVGVGFVPCLTISFFSLLFYPQDRVKAGLFELVGSVAPRVTDAAALHSAVARIVAACGAGGGAESAARAAGDALPKVLAAAQPTEAASRELVQDLLTRVRRSLFFFKKFFFFTFLLFFRSCSRARAAASRTPSPACWSTRAPPC